MKRTLCLIITLCFLANFAEAQINITINGTTANGAGKTVELYKYADKISQMEVLLAKKTIGEDQSFSLQCYANYPMLVFLQIENYSQSFYVEPGRDYDIYIGQFNWAIDETQNVFLEPVALPLEFLNLPANDINILIDNFNKVVDKYMVGHQVQLDQRFRPQRRYFDSLVVAVNKQCPDVEGCDFFNRYKYYTLGEMKLNMKFASRKKIFQQYIKDQPVLCYDENYMSFFTTFYANAISKGTPEISVYRLAHWVYNLDMKTYIDSLGVDPLLRHEQVRELAALLALKESYYNFRYYDDEMVMKMIERIEQSSKFAEHKIIAHNIIESLYRAKAGSEVKSSVLPDVNKKMISLDSLKGKWIYLSFVRVTDPNSVGEIETMAHFKDSVYSRNDNVEFVTIVCDREFQKMYHFLKNSKHGDRYDWLWLHFNGDFDLLNRFEVCSYPTFILINPEGKLQYDVTPAPSTGFLLHAPWQKKEEPQQQQKSMLFQNR